MPIGILGGGQLARMMVEQGHKNGLDVLVLSKLPSDPAAQVTQKWCEGDIDSIEDLRNFFKKCSLVTFESEFCDVEKINQALKSYPQTLIFPSPKILETLQDRLLQKNWLDDFHLPTAEYTSLKKSDSIGDALSRLGTNTGVIKLRRFGYDGYGTYAISSPNLIHKAQSWFDEAQSDAILEKLIPFKREMAITVARSQDGSIAFLPLVESFQTDNKCDWVKGPIHHDKIGPIKKKIKKALDTSQYVGCITFELFDWKNQILINEIAPRVHNSAHYSLEATSSDQFLLHMICGLGIRIEPIQCLSNGFAMANIVSKSKKCFDVLPSQKSHLHWYGKEQFRPGRKMGHLTCLGSSPENALKKAKLARKEYEL